MPFTMRLLRTHLTGASAAIAAFSLPLFGLTATEGPSAREYQTANGEDLSTLQDRALKCDSVGYRSKTFIFRDESQIREIRMCVKDDGTEAFADAEHLASGLVRASNEDRGGGEPQSAELAGSRESQARTVNNHSAPVDDHVGRPASFEELVKSLEAKLPRRPD